jgi:hypothetical protein
MNYRCIFTIDSGFPKLFAVNFAIVLVPILIYEIPITPSFSPQDLVDFNGFFKANSGASGG